MNQYENLNIPWRNYIVGINKLENTQRGKFVTTLW